MGLKNKKWGGSLKNDRPKTTAFAKSSRQTKNQKNHHVMWGKVLFAYMSLYNETGQRHKNTASLGILKLNSICFIALFTMSWCCCDLLVLCCICHCIRKTTNDHFCGTRRDIMIFRSLVFAWFCLILVCQRTHANRAAEMHSHFLLVR